MNCWSALTSHLCSPPFPLTRQYKSSNTNWNRTTLANRTTLSPNKVAELLEVTLRFTYFTYGDYFYEQREGAEMGSPVSAAVANLYMEYFEDLALSQAPDACVPCIWKRYVEDTFCILKKGAVEELTIQFTVEVERDSSLPFLDTLLQRKEDGSLGVTVYSKPTHTDRYLDFQSHHPHHVKRGLVRCLYDTQRPPLVLLPYVSGVSEDIRRVCRGFGIRVIFKTGRSLRSMLTKVKDTLPAEKQSRVVYQIPCTCGKTYIGEMTRRLETRMKEHQEACCRVMLERSAV